MQTRDRKPNTSVEKFARALLSTTCLTVASASVAHASLITEGSAPAPSDFSNNFPGYSLPLGTTQVNGISTTYDADWFEFSGLVGGSAFTFNAVYAPGFSEQGLYVNLYNDTGSPLSVGGLDGGGFTFSGVVPANGNIVANIGNNGERGNQAGYRTSLTASEAEAPEPGTIVTAGLAIAGALAWRRSRRGSA